MEQQIPGRRQVAEVLPRNSASGPHITNRPIFPKLTSSKSLHSKQINIVLDQPLQCDDHSQSILAITSKYISYWTLCVVTCQPYESTIHNKNRNNGATCTMQDIFSSRKDLVLISILELLHDETPCSIGAHPTPLHGELHVSLHFPLWSLAFRE
jgi:hypothetical protein